MNALNLSAMGRTLSGLALLFSLSLPSHAVSIGRDSLYIGGNARITLDSAIAGLAFSNGVDNPFAPFTSIRSDTHGVIGALNVMNAAVMGDALAPVATGYAQNIFRIPPYQRVTTVIQPTTVDVGFGANGEFQNISFDGSFTIESPHVPGVTGGGIMTLSDLKLDPRRGMITADVTSNPGTTFASGGNDLDIFRIGELRGVTGLNYQGAASALSEQGWAVKPSVNTGAVNMWELTGWLEASQLQATQAFQDEFFYALDVTTAGTAYNMFSAQNQLRAGWGVFRLGMGLRLHGDGWSTATMPPVVVDYTQMLRPVSSVPEPGAISLALLGLLGMSWKARTRSPKNGASCGHAA